MKIFVNWYIELKRHLIRSGLLLIYWQKFSYAMKWQENRLNRIMQFKLLSLGSLDTESKKKSLKGCRTAYQMIERLKKIKTIL